MLGRLLVLSVCSVYLQSTHTASAQTSDEQSLSHSRQLHVVQVPCNGATVGPNGYELDELCEEKGPWYIRAGHPNDGNEGNEGNEGDEGIVLSDFFSKCSTWALCNITIKRPHCLVRHNLRVPLQPDRVSFEP